MTFSQTSKTLAVVDDRVLGKIESAFTLLSEVETIEEAKNVIDMAVTAQVYAKRIKASLAVMQKAAEIQSRAERLLGQMLARTPKSRGAAGIGTSAVPKENRTLADMGIDKKLSARSQYIASIPDERFEDAVDNLKRGERIPTPRQVIKISNQEPAAPTSTTPIKVNHAWPDTLAPLKKLWSKGTMEERELFEDWIQQEREKQLDIPEELRETFEPLGLSAEHVVKTKRVIDLHPELQSDIETGKRDLNSVWLYMELGCWEYVLSREAACAQEIK